MSTSVSAANPPPMPPSTSVDGFLDPVTHRALLDWTLENAARFKPATVHRPDGTRVDTTARDNLKLADLGPVESALRERLLAALPSLSGDLGCRFPPDVILELELTAYGDGAFYQAHTDVGIPGKDEARRVDPEPRLLSAVYYFHRQPKAFEGGALRLYRWGDGDPADAANYVDLEPADNRLVAFLSWARHEVRPVRCPSARFEDYRFALNCWYRTPLPA
ncbi:MAG TPA: 2OG-Fe(II) oxygenase [Sphingomicrobium sp.]|nr:2OG-Fe(II) oxygenase [Sphingomicrobium sp.]